MSLGMLLDLDQLAIIGKVGRKIPDPLRDDYFKHCADYLRPIALRGGIEDADVAAAVNDAT